MYTSRLTSQLLQCSLVLRPSHRLGFVSGVGADGGWAWEQGNMRCVPDYSADMYFTYLDGNSPIDQKQCRCEW